MKKISAFMRLRCIAAVCCLFAAAMLSGCQFGTFSDRSLENPKQAILDFVEAMQADVFDDAAAEAAMAKVGNYSTMGFEKYTSVNDDVLEKTLFDLLRKSYEVDFSNSDLESISSPYQGVDMTVSGKQAQVTFTFTYLNLSAMSGPLSEAVSQTGTERVYEGENFDTEESAMALVEEVFLEMYGSADVSEYCVQKEFTLELSYHEDGWKLNISEEFYNALLGK